MFIDAELLYAPEIGRGSTAVSAVNNIPLFQQKLCQIGAVLAGDASNERFFHESNHLEKLKGFPGAPQA